MRDPNRLDDFYKELCKIHKENCPDFRFFQMIGNIMSAYGTDFFYAEEDKALKYIKEYFEKADDSSGK